MGWISSPRYTLKSAGTDPWLVEVVRVDQAHVLDGVSTLTADSPALSNSSLNVEPPKDVCRMEVVVSSSAVASISGIKINSSGTGRLQVVASGLELPSLHLHGSDNVHANLQGVWVPDISFTARNVVEIELDELELAGNMQIQAAEVRARTDSSPGKLQRSEDHKYRGRSEQPRSMPACNVDSKRQRDLSQLAGDIPVAMLCGDRDSAAAQECLRGSLSIDVTEGLCKCNLGSARRAIGRCTGHLAPNWSPSCSQQKLPPGPTLQPCACVASVVPLVSGCCLWVRRA